MLRRLVLPLLTFTLALLSGCQTAPSSSSLSEVEALEHARFQAWVKGDAAAMRPMLGDDLLYCHSSGVCQNKDEIIASIVSKETEYRKMEIVSFKPRLLAPNVVLINGKVNVVVFDKGTELKFSPVYTDAYVKRDGRWQLVTWQSTRAPS